MCTRARAKVLSPEGEPELFGILAEVMQSHTLEPYIFVIVLDYAVRQAIDGREKKLGFQLIRQKIDVSKVITDSKFTDNVALLQEYNLHIGTRPSHGIVCDDCVEH